MGKGGNTGTNVTTATNEPWKELSPYLIGYLNNTADWFYGPGNWQKTQGAIYDINANPYGGTSGYGGGTQGGSGGGTSWNPNNGPAGGGLVGVNPQDYDMTTVQGQQDYKSAVDKQTVSGQPLINDITKYSPGLKATGSQPTSPYSYAGDSFNPSGSVYGAPSVAGTIGGTGVSGQYQPGQGTAQPNPYLPTTGGQGAITYSELPMWMQQPMVAPVDPLLSQAYSMTAQKAMNQSPLVGAAKQNALNSLSGMYMDPTTNPAFQTGVNKLSEQYMNKILPGIASQFSLAGRTGSGAQQDAVKGAAGSAMDSINSLWSNIYNQEKQNQLAYSQMMPTFEAQDYAALQALAGVGQANMDYQQQLINAPLQHLQQFGALFAPGSGYGIQTNATPMYNNPYAGALGGAAAGAGLGLKAGGPYGALIGAGIGGLGGYYAGS